MVDIKEQVVLNGLKQTIHIKGNNESNPVLLFLHGGPGVTNRHSVMTGNDDLLDDFTIVAWDQRGTAGSYFGCKKETLTIDQLTKDAAALVDYLCNKFHKEKIFAIGGSWGSLLGCNLLKCYPEKLAAFIGFGQVVNLDLNERISWKFCVDEATKANDTKSLKILNEIGEPVNAVYKGGFSGMMKQRRIMMKYGGYSKNEGKRNYFDAMLKPILKSGEYTFKELIGYILGYKFVLTEMWEEMGHVDFNKTHIKFTKPIFILDGRLDKNTPSELVEDWFNKIEAPVKELHWFDESGHNPMFDEPEKFKKLLKDKFLDIAKKEKM